MGGVGGRLAIIGVGFHQESGAFGFRSELLQQDGCLPDHVLLVRAKQHVERLVQLVPGDLLGIDVDLGEERPVQGSLHDLVAGRVRGLGCTQQRERFMEHLLADFQALVGTLDDVPQVGGFLADSINAFAKLVLGPVLLGCKI